MIHITLSKCPGPFKLVHSKLWDQEGSLPCPRHLSVYFKYPQRYPCPRAGWPLQLSGREKSEQQAAKGVKCTAFLRTARKEIFFLTEVTIVCSMIQKWVQQRWEAGSPHMESKLSVKNSSCLSRWEFPSWFPPARMSPGSDGVAFVCSPQPSYSSPAAWCLCSF